MKDLDKKEFVKSLFRITLPNMFKLNGFFIVRYYFGKFLLRRFANKHTLIMFMKRAETKVKQRIRRLTT